MAHSLNYVFAVFGISEKCNPFFDTSSYFVIIGPKSAVPVKEDISGLSKHTPVTRLLLAFRNLTSLFLQKSKITVPCSRE